MALDRKYMAVSAAAKELGICRATMYNWINEGIIRAHYSTKKLNRYGMPRMQLLRDDVKRLAGRAI